MKKLILGIIMFVIVLTSFCPTTLVMALDRVNIEEGVYEITSKLHEDMSLDIAGGSKNSGGNLQLYRYNGTTSQLFWIEKSGSYYTISPMCSGMMLDVQGGEMKSGTNVQQYYSNNTSAQKWRFYDIGNEYCYIACGNYALDVSGGIVNNGTNIQLYKPNATASQMWKLKKVVSPRWTNTFSAYVNSGEKCIVKINNSLINKKGYQKASIKIKTYTDNNKSTNGKVVVTLRDMSNRLVWKGVKSGGDTLKLGDDYAAYIITIERYDSGNGPIKNGNDFLNVAKTIKFDISNQKDCQLYKAY
ncbi:MAG: RICIN domain-containing protein [Lachnospiraceae bacterium]